MGYVIAVERVMMGTESLRILDGLVQWAGEHNIPVDRVHEALVFLIFEADYEPAREVVEDGLADLSETWTTHVRIAPQRQ